MVSQELVLTAGTMNTNGEQVLPETEAERLRSQAFGLLRQIGPEQGGQLSQQGRKLLYRLAFLQMVLGVWVEQYGLPRTPQPGSDLN